jgi:multidrug efflux pump subunit AcrA (membrane-fusion protein)
MCDAFRLLGIALIATAAVSCAGSGNPSGDALSPAAAPGPPTIDIVRVVEQPLDVELSLPGELTAYQMVAIYPRVTGFVKSVAVDRGSRVRAGDVLAILDAPEVVAQRSEAQSKLQAAEAPACGLPCTGRRRQRYV